mmetsp:Transcript_7139/g.6229  ORF Transcript_7139/g.6229 Transcript_7139/m.6229 type:complete len:91 (+) Transcript_7139:73-345(+)
MLCYVNVISFLLTIAMFFATIAILIKEPEDCTEYNLRLTLFLILGMHAINTTEQICGLTGLDHIFCGCCCVIGFFLYEIAVLVYMVTVWW